MTGIRDVPDPIQWYEGMLLAPQHFQQEALRTQASIAAHLKLSNPFHWGVVHLLLDPAALVSGLVRVLELEAVMPDGLLVWHEASKLQPLELDVSKLADPLAKLPVTIHLTVPTVRRGTWGGKQRWLSVDGDPVPDENDSPGDDLTIPRLRPRLELVATTKAGERPPPRFLSLPIARLAVKGDAFSPDEFAPPCLTVTANSTIGRLCADVARRLREKATLLAKRTEAGGAREGGTDPFVEVRSLVVGLPPVEAQLAAEASHPFDLFVSMCTLLGHASALASGGIPPTLPRYDHADPLPSFVEVRDHLVRMMERVRQVAEPIRFSFENGMFGLEMKPEWMTRRLFVGVQGPAPMSTAELVAWVENAVIGSHSKLEELASLRVKGATRTLVDNAAEAGITPPRGTVLFSIEHDPRLVAPGERLEIWNPDNLGSRYRPADIILYVLT